MIVSLRNQFGLQISLIVTSLIIVPLKRAAIRIPNWHNFPNRAICSIIGAAPARSMAIRGP